MTWRQYYEKFYDWADSTQRSRLSSVTDFSGAKAEEVIEIALAFVDEVPATRLMKKAIDSGVRFSAEDVMEVIDWVRADFRLPLRKARQVPLRKRTSTISIRCSRRKALMPWPGAAALPMKRKNLSGGSSLRSGRESAGRAPLERFSRRLVPVVLWP